MLVSGEVLYISTTRGTSKNTGEPYNLIKVLDDDADSFCTFFTDDDVAEKLQTLPKRTPLVLNVQVALGSKYFKVESVEIVSHK